LADKNIVMLSLAYFCLVNTINVNATWIPTIVRGVLQTRAISYVAMVAAIPAVFAIILMPLWAISSDRKKERSWHVVAALALAALGWQLVIFARQPELRLLGLVFTTSGAFCGMSVFWTLPQTLLSETARPAGIAVISSVGLMGSASSPTVIGFLRDLTGNFAAGLLYSTILLVISMVLVLAVSRRQVAETSRKKLSAAGVGGSSDV
jgi:ACS family 4-hydroxyphenylacetate permease-like MFS transporter